MEYQGFTKQDWMLFREKIGGWQEAYMDRLNKEYIALLNGESSPADKFWSLDRRLKEDKRKAGVQIQLSKSNMIFDLVDLLSDGAISLEDLSGFSEDLQETVKFIWQGRDHAPPDPE